jgi:putative sterol carrier protein
MSDVVAGAVKALNEKLDGEGIEGSVKFVIEDEGAVRVDETGASADDSDAECTLTASRETFEALMAGDLDPTAAFMNGELTVDGDMGLAMKLGSLLA